MAATNFYRNVCDAKIGGVAFTSVKEIAVTDQTTKIQSGSDCDTDFTVTILGAKKTQVRITVDDAAVAFTLLSNVSNEDLTWTEHAEVGTDIYLKVAACTFGQVDASGTWGNQRVYVVTAEGGAFTRVGGAS